MFVRMKTKSFVKSFKYKLINSLATLECLFMSVVCGILKMVGPVIQKFCPRINMLKGNCRNCTFKVNFLCQKSTEFFERKKKSHFNHAQFLTNWCYPYSQITIVSFVYTAF